RPANGPPVRHQTAWVSLDGHLPAALTGLLNAGHKTAHSRPAAGGGRNLESPDPGDDGAPGPVQGEYHCDTPAVKVENVADDDSQREVEGGDHRFPLEFDHGGQPPPVDPAAQDRGRRRDLPGRGVPRPRSSPQGLDQGGGRAAVLPPRWPYDIHSHLEVAPIAGGGRDRDSQLSLAARVADGEPDDQELEEPLAHGPVNAVPTLPLEGDANGAPHPDASSSASKFS